MFENVEVALTQVDPAKFTFLDIQVPDHWDEDQVEQLATHFAEILQNFSIKGTVIVHDTGLRITFGQLTEI